MEDRVHVNVALYSSHGERIFIIFQNPEIKHLIILPAVGFAKKAIVLCLPAFPGSCSTIIHINQERRKA